MPADDDWKGERLIPAARREKGEDREMKEAADRNSRIVRMVKPPLKVKRLGNTGNHGARKVRVSEAHYREAFAGCVSQTEVARKLGVSCAAVSHAKKKYGLKLKGEE